MPTYLEKTKRKPDQMDSRFNSVLIYLGVKPTPVDFMVGESLETCMARLRSKVQTQEYFGYLLNRASIEVSLYQTDDTHCRFRVLKKQYRTSFVEMTGSLEQLSDVNTHITGSVETQGFLTQITLPIIIIMLVAFIIFSILLERLFPFNVLLDVFVMAMLTVIIINTEDDRHRFIRFVEDSLTRPESVDIRKKKNDWF